MRRTSKLHVAWLVELGSPVGSATPKGTPGSVVVGVMKVGEGGEGTLGVVVTGVGVTGVGVAGELVLYYRPVLDIIAMFLSEALGLAIHQAPPEDVVGVVAAAGLVGVANVGDGVANVGDGFANVGDGFANVGDEGTGGGDDDGFTMGVVVGVVGLIIGTESL
ncbi:hypothetical protein CDL15_Pgr001153 [Punica granatum]|uniref:Uncharacterized protein n=1 Tax=Punica granatum TaxID=22663 RepID=A0A218WKQ0_PUNGR|nr:hypothetical protein CDL15_Pgr001153 [Punica granatum]